MAVIQKEFNYMAFPQSFSRGNPIPLDKSSLWFSMEEMVNYSKTDPCSYVGQILTLVNETEGSARVYSIIDTAGTLQEVGSATMGDDASIVLTNSTLSLKNWGARYYRWVEGTEGAAGRYELQEVDETHPWKAGLEPKVALTDGGALELAWYEPNPITVEGLSSAIGTVQTGLETLSGIVGTASDPAGSDTIYGQLNEKITEAQAQTLISSAVASAGHLRREIVETLPDPSAADPDVIYMVKDAFALGPDKYKEYMLIAGVLVQIGDTSVDLTNYVQKKSEVAEGVLVAFDASGDIKSSGKTVMDFVAAEDGKRLMTNEEGDRLAELVGLNDVNFTAPLVFNSETKTLSVSEATESTPGILSAELFNKLNGIETGAQANVIEGARVGETAVEVDENKNLVFNIATTVAAGFVRASDEVNVAADGQMSLGKVNAMKIYVEKEDELILNGGNSAD